MTSLQTFSTVTQMEDVLRNLPSGVVVFDAAGQVTQINPALLEIFHLRLHPAELIGQGWRAFFDRLAPLFHEPELELARIKTLIQQDQPEQSEIQLSDGRHLVRHYAPLLKDGEIKGALWQLQDLTAHKARERQLSYLTERDPLTGLLNRRGFDRRLQMLQQHPLGQQGFTLALIDLDDFKRVNDTLGHSAGDEVLVEVAHRLKTLVRLTDMPARIGGDEFAILMPECRTEEMAVQIAERILRAVPVPMQIGDTEIRQGCSAGLAVQRRTGNNKDDIFQRADLALYDAKSSGRNRFKLFSQRLKHQHDTLQHQREMLSDGLKHRRLQLHYQPILTLEPETARFFVRTVAVRLRREDAQGQWRRAEEFEAALADPLLGMEVDRYVLDAALGQLTAWKRQGAHLRLALNVSPHHFAHPQFVETVQEQFHAHPEVRPQDISLEITEHGPALNQRAVSATILELRRLGLSISLDDFGTGNASLAHLQQFDVSVVKIDRRFVRDMLQDGIDLSLSYGMLRLAQMLGIGAIAEGVETRTQCRALSLLGFRHMQGYLFAQPMPAGQVLQWLQTYSAELSWLADLAQPRVLEAEQAVQALVTHRMRARKLLSRTLDASEVQDLLHPHARERCHLGQWLQEQAKQHEGVPQFQKLVQAHARFHECMRVAMNKADADADLELNQSSSDVHTAFWDWVLRMPEPRALQPTAASGVASSTASAPVLPEVAPRYTS
jgi:diguanylate cyclase (GGDEF)-like protein/PAS domain S-box-containing protein